MSTEKKEHFIRLCNLQEYVIEHKVPFIYLLDLPVKTNYNIKNGVCVGDIYSEFHHSFTPLYKHVLLTGAHPSCMMQLADRTWKKIESCRKHNK